MNFERGIFKNTEVLKKARNSVKVWKMHEFLQSVKKAWISPKCEKSMNFSKVWKKHEFHMTWIFEKCVNFSKKREFLQKAWISEKLVFLKKTWISQKFLD